MLQIVVDKFECFHVVLPVSTEKAARFFAKGPDGFDLFDHSGETFDEHHDWVSYSATPAWYANGIEGFSLRSSEDGYELVISGWIVPEGDDALDHTRELKELSLSNILGVAKVARAVLN